MENHDQQVEELLEVTTTSTDTSPRDEECCRPSCESYSTCKWGWRRRANDAICGAEMSTNQADMESTQSKCCQNTCGAAMTDSDCPRKRRLFNRKLVCPGAGNQCTTTRCCKTSCHSIDFRGQYQNYKANSDEIYLWRAN
ncbi:unnamed protein product [Amoebophrya sp. A25]|nr:unnamed protein product [Amoebophrya sp. A25]|eukprot:GSA25T00014004001.1